MLGAAAGEAGITVGAGGTAPEPLLEVLFTTALFALFAVGAVLGTTGVMP